jgi:hypothetical protein
MYGLETYMRGKYALQVLLRVPYLLTSQELSTNFLGVCYHTRQYSVTTGKFNKVTTVSCHHDPIRTMII